MLRVVARSLLAVRFIPMGFAKMPMKSALPAVVQEQAAPLRRIPMHFVLRIFAIPILISALPRLVLQTIPTGYVPWEPFVAIPILNPAKGAR